MVPDNGAAAEDDDVLSGDEDGPRRVVLKVPKDNQTLWGRLEFHSFIRQIDFH
jgi:hypothetical protein